MALPAQLNIDEGATPSEVLAITQCFCDAGIEPTVDVLRRRGIGDLPWVIYVTAPIQAFLAAVATSAG